MNPSDSIKWNCLCLAVQALDSQRFKSGEDKSTVIMDLADKMASWASATPTTKASISVVHNSTVRN
jgi:hypothetical protein